MSALNNNNMTSDATSKDARWSFSDVFDGSVRDQSVDGVDDDDDDDVADDGDVSLSARIASFPAAPSVLVGGDSLDPDSDILNNNDEQQHRQLAAADKAIDELEQQLQDIQERCITAEEYAAKLKNHLTTRVPNLEVLVEDIVGEERRQNEEKSKFVLEVLQRKDSAIEALESELRQAEAALTTAQQAVLKASSFEALYEEQKKISQQLQSCTEAMEVCVSLHHAFLCFFLLCGCCVVLCLFAFIHMVLFVSSWCVVCFTGETQEFDINQ